MGKPDIPSTSSFECRNILDSIQNEFEEWQRKDNILSKVHEDLADLIAQRNLLSKRQEFNEKYCVLCCSAFNLLFKRKVFCQYCNFWVCRSCSLWDNSTKLWLCKVCEKQKLLDAESRAWISNRVKTSFGLFWAAKALQGFCRARRISDSENDSGYGTAGDFMPLMKLLSSHSLNKDFKMADISSHDEDCEEDEDDGGDEEELAEIHHSIETILEGLLGGTLDDASVDHLYPNCCLYINLFSVYHIKLVEAIQNLSKALQKALHNLPSENGLTPTTAHAALKNVIGGLVEECQDLPPLQVLEKKDLDLSISSSFDFADIFSSYDSLVAAAVINKVVEECQSKFKENDLTSFEGSFQAEQEREKVLDDYDTQNEEPLETYNSVTTNATGFDFPVECVKIEEIEEITQEFTDSEDDKLSSISKWSNSLQSVEEAGIQKNPDVDLFIGMDPTNEGPTPFPEFGCDLVEEHNSKDFSITCRPTTISSWEANWLFRKRKRLPLYSNLRYQLMTYCDEPPSMLIPCPSESDIIEEEEFSSELSETQSAGSLDFSSEPDETKLEVHDLKVKTELQNVVQSESLLQTCVKPSPVALPTESLCKSQKHEKCHVDDSKNDISLVHQTDHALYKESEYVPISPCLSTEKNSNKKTIISPMNSENSFVETPPRPGTIAEREHQKWLNAIPLKNNPYSAENISKRYNYSKKSVLEEPISSFEEFERKLSVSSETSEPTLSKLNCGPKSIDSELYKRDYYVNKEGESPENVYPVKKPAKHLYSLTDNCFETLSEEALNSFEEKVYVSSGKVFTLENHVKRLEREIKDISPSSDIQSEQSLHSRGLTQIISNKPLQVSNRTECEKIKKSKPCMKVHSLTARSLSREFRDLAKQNAPKPMNRTIQVPSNSFDDGASERESLCSPESLQSSFDTVRVDNVHGYTSDESNTSTSSIPRSKVRRHISRSILQRASYWERRAEQGLLSDASVNEEFPGIDINPE